MGNLGARLESRQSTSWANNRITKRLFNFPFKKEFDLCNQLRHLPISAGISSAPTSNPLIMSSKSHSPLSINDGYGMSDIRYCGHHNQFDHPAAQWEPRYLLPALAKAMGGSIVDWQAASWTILSSWPVRFKGGQKVSFLTPKEYWQMIFRVARSERSSRK